VGAYGSNFRPKLGKFETGKQTGSSCQTAVQKFNVPAYIMCHTSLLLPNYKCLKHFFGEFDDLTLSAFDFRAALDIMAIKNKMRPERNLVKVSRYTPWRRMGERSYSSYSYLTSAPDGGEWSASRPGSALPPGKGPLVPTGYEAGWVPEPVWTQGLEEKSSAPAGIRTPIVQPVVRHCTA
jgi:hypothetical protein